MSRIVLLADGHRVITPESTNASNAVRANHR